MENKTVLVTGGTDGIGRETALQLARMRTSVLVHGRDKEKGARVPDDINRDTCNEKVGLYLADFSSLADKLDGTSVTANALHPGVVDTKLLRKSYHLDGTSVEEGAQTSVYLASSLAVEGVSGKYYKNMQERPASDI